MALCCAELITSITSWQEEVAGAVVDDANGAVRNFSRTDLRQLFELDEDDVSECGTVRLVRGYEEEKARQMKLTAKGDAAAAAPPPTTTSSHTGWNYTGPDSVCDEALRKVAMAAELVTYVRTIHSGNHASNAIVATATGSEGGGAGGGAGAVASAALAGDDVGELELGGDDELHGV